MTLPSHSLESAIRWKIENFSLQKGILESPHFYSFNSEWCVEILLKDMSPSGDVIKICFRQLTERVIQANWSCAFLNSNGLLLNLSEMHSVINSGKSSGVFIRILKYDDIFNASNLPNDILTIESRIWCDSPSLLVLQPTGFKVTPLLPPAACEQHRVVMRKNFLWGAFVSHLKPGQTVNHAEPLLRDKVLKIKLDKETNQRLIVILEMPKSTVLANCNIYLSNRGVKCEQFKEDIFNPYKSSFNVYYFYLNFVSYDEMKKFFFNNILELLFSCTFYDTCMETIFGKSSSQKTVPNHKTCSRAISDEPQNNQPPLQDTPFTICQDLRSMYEEGFMSDFNLRAQDRTFSVHKNILGARSSVFRAMFTADMKEKESGHVEIPDVDADTLQRMLEFVYCEHMDKNLQWESACSLYSAADKYALEPLKQRCSSHLRANLSDSSVLGVLLLSDTHQDQVLKAAALDYISRNDKNIIGTERWNRFKEENGPLSLEILQQLYMKKMAG